MMERPSDNNRRGWAVCALVSLGMTALLFNRVVFAGEWLARRDTLRVYLPLAKYWTDRVKNGEFPEWYPFTSLGQPFVGMLVSAPFHPARLLYLLLPIEHAHAIHTLLCYPFAALFVFACARRLGLSSSSALFAAVTYLGSGYLVSISNNLAYLVAAATIPAALWAADRFVVQPRMTALALAAVALTLVLFSGDVQSFLLTGAAIALIAFIRPLEATAKQRAIRVALLLTCALGLCSPQLLPAWATLKEARGSVNPLATAQLFSLHPSRLAELPLGALFIDPESGVIPKDYASTGLIDQHPQSAWVDSICVGVLALALAALGATAGLRKRMGTLLVVAGALSLLLLLGRYLPLYALFYRFVPLWSAFRYPEKLAVWLTLVLALGAGVGLQRALRDTALARRLGLSLCALAALLAVVALAAGPWPLVGVPEARLPEVLWRLRLHAGVAAGVCAASAASLLFMRLRSAGAVLIALQAGLLTWLSAPLPQSIQLDVLQAPTGFAADALRLGAGKPGGARVEMFARIHQQPRLEGYTGAEAESLGVIATLAPDAQALFGLETSGYYHPAGSERFVTLWTRGEQWRRTFATLYGTSLFTTDFNDVKLYQAIPGNQIVALLREWGLVLWRSDRALARAYLARPRCASGRDDAYDLILEPSFRRGAEAVVECGRRDGPATTGPGSPGEARVERHEPERVEVWVKASEPALLVLNDAHYSGWSATVDGAAADILPTNVAVRGVRVEPGEHRVVFRYRQPLLREGLLAALLTALLLGAAMAVERRRSPAAQA